MLGEPQRSGPQRQERRAVPPLVSESSKDGFLPQKMTFKAFLATQDDSITDEEAAHKYSEYKLEFKRQHLNEFFSNHKDSEWFRKKYHPIDGKKRKDEFHARVVKRFEIYQKMQKEGFLENLELNIDNDLKGSDTAFAAQSSWLLGMPGQRFFSPMGPGALFGFLALHQTMYGCADV